MTATDTCFGHFREHGENSTLTKSWHKSKASSVWISKERKTLTLPSWGSRLAGIHGQATGSCQLCQQCHEHLKHSPACRCNMGPSSCSDQICWGGQTISPITSSHESKAVLEAKANYHSALKGLITHCAFRQSNQKDYRHQVTILSAQVKSKLPGQMERGEK